MSAPYSAHRQPKNMGDAVRLFCLECQGAHEAYSDSDGHPVPEYRPFTAVRDCPSASTCSLWPYRFGKDPKKSEAAKARVRENPDLIAGLR
jgi:hypothetical protein